MPTLSLAEQETILRYDQEEKLLHLYTSHPGTARKWEKRGYTLELNHLGWSTVVPLKCLPPLKKLTNGSLTPRKGPGNAAALVLANKKRREASS